MLCRSLDSIPKKTALSTQMTLSLALSTILRLSPTRVTAFSARHAPRRPRAVCRLFASSSSPPAPSRFYAPAETSFRDLGLRCDDLVRRIEGAVKAAAPTTDVRPSCVQSLSFEALAAEEDRDDVIVGAETGSGKTYAYLLPLIDDILQKKKAWREKRNKYLKALDDDDTFTDEEAAEGEKESWEYAHTLVVVPNRELVDQIVRMALPLCRDENDENKDVLVVTHSTAREDLVPDDDNPHDDVKYSQIKIGTIPGGLSSPDDYRPYVYHSKRRSNSHDSSSHPPVDILVGTPAALSPFARNTKDVLFFADIHNVVFDEADMLFDGGYRRHVDDILMGFRRADRLLRNDDAGSPDAAFRTASAIPTRHVFVAATLPDSGLRSIDAYLRQKFPKARQIRVPGMHQALHHGLLARPDPEAPAAPAPTAWIRLESNRDRLRAAADLLLAAPGELVDVTEDAGETAPLASLGGEKVMVFCNSVEDVEGVAAALRRAGVRALPYHAKLSLTVRAEGLDVFRAHDPRVDRGEPPVLVCTDLAARGLDVPGVTAVLQLQFAGNVVSHLHRAGRCGRAGRRDGRSIVFYGEKERELVEVLQEAEGGVLEVQGAEVDDEGKGHEGTVREGFSRKRGFTKKRKKLRRSERED